MFHRYEYEAQYYEKLNRVPLDVRRKLDLTGVKFSLNDWLAFSLEERTVLCHLPSETGEEQAVLRQFLDFLMRRYRGKPSELTEPLKIELWEDKSVPAEITHKSATLGRTVDLQEWRRWPAHHRYALYKTANSQSQPEAFEQVLHQLRGEQRKT